jgi:LAO/AO transport system kinase
VEELAKNIDKLLKEKSINYKECERKMLEDELTDMVLNNLEKKVSSMIAQDRRYSEFIDRLAKKEIDPYVAAEELATILLR